MQRDVTFHLEPALRDSAVAGQHPFIAKMAAVLEGAGFTVSFPENGRASPHALTHMAQPVGAKGLVFRRAYHYPFWQIDPRAERWLWQVAHRRFDPAGVPKQAEGFYRRWQKRLFGEGAVGARRGDFLYVPLQGKLDRHRSFQSCAPLAMLEHCLTCTDRPVIAALHPSETYSDAETAALETLLSRFPRLQITLGGMEQHLAGCHAVVSQNSAAAFNGILFGKPMMLFAGADFHHIAVRPDFDDLPASFAALETHQPPYAAYLWWFWQDQCINAGREDALAQIAVKLRDCGWKV